MPLMGDEFTAIMECIYVKQMGLASILTGGVVGTRK